MVVIFCIFTPLCLNIDAVIDTQISLKCKIRQWVLVTGATQHLGLHL